jgi:hypothetical protein
MQNNVQDFIAKIDNTIKRVENRLLFDGNNEPSLYELNLALAQHEHDHLNLIMLYEESKYDLQIAKESYEEWYAEKYEEERSLHNSLEIAGTKWLAASEISNIVKTKYKKEIAVFKKLVVEAEIMVSTNKRMLDGWEKYAFVLSQLSKNSIAQVNVETRGKDISGFNPND